MSLTAAKFGTTEHIFESAAASVALLNSLLNKTSLPKDEREQLMTDLVSLYGQLSQATMLSKLHYTMGALQSAAVDNGPSKGHDPKATHGVVALAMATREWAEEEWTEILTGVQLKMRERFPYTVAKVDQMTRQERDRVLAQIKAAAAEAMDSAKVGATDE